MNIDEQYMQRCLELANLANGFTAPNPMVGCVIVHDGKIIGEGFHKKAGEPHAEVNAINSVKDQSLLPETTLYVNLEPCSHHGKTPPCSDLIVEKKVKRVVVAMQDPHKAVAGKGLERLRKNGIEVKTGVLEREALQLNRPFITFHTKKRPFITLKWAKSADGFIDHHRISSDKSAQAISGQHTAMLTHKMRSRHAAIMVGTRTAWLDNPSLNTRYWNGNEPVRITLDRNVMLPKDLKLFTDGKPTVVFNAQENHVEGEVVYKKCSFDNDLIPSLLHDLHELQVQSLFVEGGSMLLQSFIERNLWDDAWLYSSPKVLTEGVKAPTFNFPFKNRFSIGNDLIEHYEN
jgi:diaminohydroxyphosphoribosylaminopyrimidine deaminase/5-amino-6-(5-phosphoribosylamino)uracil reductase